MWRRWTGFWLVVAMLAAVPAALAAGGTPYERAVQLERAGDFSQALTLLQHARLNPAQARHRTALQNAVAAFAAMRIYEQRRQQALAATTLRQLRTQLDPVRDVYLRSTAEQRLAGLPAPSTAQTFGTRVWNGFADIARPLLSWLLAIVAVAFAVLAVWGLSRIWRGARRPRRGVGVALEDLSAAPTDRADANRTLGRELSMAIEAANADHDEQPVPEIDVAKDLDGSISVNVRVAGDELAKLNQLLDGGEPIKAGPISFSPRQIVAFGNALVAPHYAHQLSGALVSGPGRSVLAVELRGDGGLIRWSCEKTGSESRTETLAEVAQRVVFELGTKQISASWPSVAAYRQARQLLTRAPATGEQRRVALEQARVMLEQSLGRDPTNLLARLELGNVLRKLGSNEEAVTQYEVLDGFSATREVPALVRRAAAYSRAVALSKRLTWPTHRAALKALEALRRDVENDPKLSREDREHLLALVYSAGAAARVFELERLRNDDTDEARERRRAVLTQITTARDQIVATQGGDGRRQATCYQALAVAENAVGRGMYLCREHTADAIRAVEHALSLVPELGDAHVNLAAMLLRTHTREEGWAERIRRHLDRALTISPHDRKARYLHGRVCMELQEYAKARSWFELAAADGDAWAAYRLAQLSHEDGKHAEALELARESLQRLDGVDQRARSLVLWTARQLVPSDGAQRDGVTPAVLSAAHRAGGALVEDARRRGTTLPDELAEAVRAIDALAAIRPEAV